MSTPEKLHVASPRACNTQQMPPSNATRVATPAQRPSLKALAREALACTNPCNKHATTRPETVQQMGNETGAKVAQLPTGVAALGQCEALDLDATQALLGMSADDAERRALRVPAGETAMLLCRFCGPVYVHPAIAGAMPTIGGIPRALGCPWCLLPKDGRVAIPRPPVTCGSCAHFAPDTINPQGGAGRCKLGSVPRHTPLPFTPQQCSEWRPLSRGAMGNVP